MEFYQELFLATLLTAPRDYEDGAEFVDALFIPGRACGDWEETNYNQGLIGRAEEIYESWGPIKIVLNGQANVDTDNVPIPTSYGGPEQWENLFLECQIPPGNIIRSTGGQNTGTEAVSFVECAKEQKWEHTMILANPHQLLRVMMAIIRAMQVTGYQLKVVPVAPRYFSWKTEGYGSQGAARESWSQQALVEATKIPDYCEQGYLCTFPELREYMLAMAK